MENSFYDVTKSVGEISQRLSGMMMHHCTAGESIMSDASECYLGEAAVVNVID